MDNPNNINYQFEADSDDDIDADDAPNVNTNNEGNVQNDGEALPEDGALLVQQITSGRLHVSNIQCLTVYEMDQFCVRGFSFADISRMLRVSPSALYRWRVAHAYTAPLAQVTNEELDTLVRAYLADNARRGEVLTMGFLRARGVAVTRQRLRDSVWRVDPAGRVQRRTLRAKRVQYNVAGVHHLWHIDGCHKLIKYGFVVHGGIDGYSRGVMFLKCVTNNRASTMLSNFLAATAEYGVPSRVRSDHGTENVDVSTYMHTTRGPNRASHITGTSMRNQRIERLWRDTTSNVLSVYMVFFEECERSGVDFSHNAIRYVMHRLFHSRIDADLQRFRAAWNAHKISTTQGARTPDQLLYMFREQGAAMRAAPPALVDPHAYGVHGAAAVNGADAVELLAAGVVADASARAVKVERTVCPFAEGTRDQFFAAVPPLSLSENQECWCERVYQALTIANGLLAAAAPAV